MNWQARPQRSGSLLRDMPQSVQSERDGGGDGRGFAKPAALLVIGLGGDGCIPRCFLDALNFERFQSACHKRQ